MSERNTTQSFINQMSMVTTKPLVEREVTNIEFVNGNTGQVVLKLDKAKVKFADATLDKENWSMAKEREIDCKVLEGQISILNKMQNEFETMLAPVMQPS